MQINRQPQKELAFSDALTTPASPLNQKSCSGTASTILLHFACEMRAPSAAVYGNFVSHECASNPEGRFACKANLTSVASKENAPFLSESAGFYVLRTFSSF